MYQRKLFKQCNFNLAKLHSKLWKEHGNGHVRGNLII